MAGYSSTSKLSRFDAARKKYIDRMGAVGVFDAHNGLSASRFLLQKFMLHLNNSVEPYSDLKEILKSSLVLAINEIDTKYSEFASRLHRKAGSTAVVALVYDKHVLVANVGDSKAFLCYQKKISHEDDEGVASLGGLLVHELTSDHNAHRLEEKVRVKASGGVFRFTRSYVPLLKDFFPLTRAIGNLPFKRYGVIADPELTDWLSLTSEDDFWCWHQMELFESLTTQVVCDFLDEVKDHSDPSLLAHQLIKKAYFKGSTDYLSVVLVPLGSGRPLVDDLSVVSCSTGMQRF